MVPSVSVGQEGSPAKCVSKHRQPLGGVRQRGEARTTKESDGPRFLWGNPPNGNSGLPTSEPVPELESWGCERRERQDQSSLSHWLILSLVRSLVPSFGTVLQRWAFLTSAFKFQPYLLNALQTQMSYLAPIGFSFLQVVPASWKCYKE